MRTSFLPAGVLIVAMSAHSEIVFKAKGKCSPGASNAQAQAENDPGTEVETFSDSQDSLEESQGAGEEQTVIASYPIKFSLPRKLTLKSYEKDNRVVGR